MPLNCDCYGGCWGDHSKNWPSIGFASSALATEAWRLCHQDKAGNSLPPDQSFPYGSYVLVDTFVRFETEALKRQWYERYGRTKLLDNL